MSLLLAVGGLVWFLPFIRPARAARPAAHRDRRARWGIALQFIGFTLVWQGPFWLRSPAIWRVAAAVVLLVAASVLSWTSTRALGRHFRLDAGLSSDHELIRSGPYALVRHPIYSSMLAFFLACGLVLDGPLQLTLATLVFLTGTEIRVRIEDRLLHAAFGAAFDDFRRRVPAYIPFIR
jgi:protein-S-isoprenylcysteine O-methyltransferase Ste14